MNPVIAIQPGAGDTGIIGIPWAEYIQRRGSTGQASLGPDANQATMEILVPWDEIEGAVDYILGWSISNGAGNGISRRLPMRHPLYPQMWAKKIARIVGLRFLEKGTSFDPGTGSGPISVYAYCVVTITFQAVPYRVISDGSLAFNFNNDEFERYTFIHPQPTGEIFQFDRGAFFKFAEGPTVGVDVPFGVTKLLPKTEIHLTWYEAPNLGLFTSNATDATTANIDSCVGRVNDDVFLGKPKGTLLCDPPRFTPHMAGVSPEILGGNIEYDPPRLWDVEFTLKYFDPPPFGTERGWNLAFIPQAGSSTIQYAMITSDGAAATTGSPGNTVYEYADFNNLFKMCGP